MKAPPDHPEEAARIAALDALGHVDTPAERRFDLITEAAREALDVPIALVSLVHRDRQWFKSAQGLSAPETERCISFCGHAILGSDIFEVPNTLEDPDFADNPLVTGPPDIRFYAGMPVHAANGLPLGTLCVIDTRARHLTEAERSRLKVLGKWLELELQNRGMSSRDLDLLTDSGLGAGETLLDAQMKCWNLEAGRLLLANVLERAVECGEEITAGAIRLVLHRSDWENLRESGADAELRYRLANLLRSDHSFGVTSFSDAPEHIYFVSSDPGRLARLPDLDGISRVLRSLQLRQGVRERISLHGAFCHVLANEDGQARCILERLHHEAGQAEAGTFVQIHV